MEQYTGYKTKIENIINVGNHNIYLNLCINYNSGLNLLLFSNNTKSPNAPLSSSYGSSSVDQKIRTIAYRWFSGKCMDSTVLRVSLNVVELYPF